MSVHTKAPLLPLPDEPLPEAEPEIRIERQGHKLIAEGEFVHELTYFARGDSDDGNGGLHARAMV